MTVALQSLIGSRIFVMRGQHVMLGDELAELYGPQTRALIQAVKRNLERFPQDFMFQHENHDLAALRSQIVTSNTGRGGRLHRTECRHALIGTQPVSSYQHRPCRNQEN